ncbi:hypothetical protein J2Z79_000876 [Symbiobacterium terraclitae]|uniref:Uncharacterized protein n=1 Tax=Symbiobacterium terraclitae TaxID=557451 RepID=A0ABS4JPM6_9FIRM|nr:hypothetical protein [Symbiobacterium terraclitae]MBP2017493.1 hypothetical protein [Symbiobacterium terraclitae]
MGTRGPGGGRGKRLRAGALRGRRRIPWHRRAGRRTGWLAALLGRVRRRWRSFWHWEVLRALRDRYPALGRARFPAQGELRHFPQRSWQ